MPQTRALWQIVKKHGEFTEEDVAEMREAISKVDRWESQTAFYHASIRTNVEIIGGLAKLEKAIGRFDKASTNLVNTTNRLTMWMLAFTVIAVFLGGASLYISRLALEH